MVVIPSKKRKKVTWKNPLEEVRIIEKIEENMKEPKYVLNILYNDKGVYLSERIQENKEMCGLWQSPGGKVEEGETSEEAVLRETAEETDIELKLQDLTYLFNDPHFNCDVYMTKLQKNQVPQQLNLKNKDHGCTLHSKHIISMRKTKRQHQHIPHILLN